MNLKQLRKNNDLRLKKELPRFADEIIANRRKIQKWVIKGAVNLNPQLIYPPDIGECEVACVYGDEDDAIDVCFILKKQIPVGSWLNSFWRTTHDS